MKSRIIIMLALCFLFTGCWNYSELSDFAIITGIGIDYKDDLYKVSAMVANGESHTSSSKEGSSQTTLLTGIGKNITEAIKDIESKSSKEIYLGHLGVLIINEKVAKKNTYEVIDSFFRNPESLKKYYIVISKKDKSENVLKVLSPLESFPSQNIITNIKNSNESIGYTPEIILSEFLYNIINPGFDSYLPSITIEGKVKNGDNIMDLNNSEVKTALKLDKIGIFKDYKLVDFATYNESKGINIINNNISSLVVDNMCFSNNSKNITTKLDNIKTDIKIKGKNKIKLSIKSDGSINETNCDIDLNNEKTIKKINDVAASNIYELVDSALKKSKKLNSDIFGIGNKFYKNKKKFNLKKLKYKIDVKVNIKTKGSLENTIKEITNEKD